MRSHSERIYTPFGQFPMKMLFCPICNTQFPKKGPRKFCSVSCCNRSRTKSVEERFWSKVDKRGPKECWPWTGALTSAGYGNFGVCLGKNSLATRLMFAFTRGEVPEDKFVCHSCDNRKCVNPSHLWLGTHTDNMQDMLKKNRGRWASKKRAI